MKPGSEEAREGMSPSFRMNAVATGPGPGQGEEDTFAVGSAFGAGWQTELVHGTSVGGAFHIDFHIGQGGEGWQGGGGS